LFDIFTKIKNNIFYFFILFSIKDANGDIDNDSDLEELFLLEKIEIEKKKKIEER
jgi:hypothetical protein